MRTIAISVVGSALAVASAQADPPPPTNFTYGISVGPFEDPHTYFDSFVVGTQSMTEVWSNFGGLVLYSGVPETVRGNFDGGVTLSGKPLSFVLGSDAGPTGTFDIWRRNNYFTPTPPAPPVFRIDTAANTAAFDTLNVQISNGTLTVGGSAVVTAATAPTVLGGQGFAQLVGGALAIPSTTASTSSSTGALTVAGGLGVASDSFINGVRVGKGGGVGPLVRKYSTALGDHALEVNTYGTHNTVVGSGSLQANTTGSYNTAFGSDVLTENTTGYNNTATGGSALQKNLTGYWNSAYGYQALSVNTEGASNAAFGGASLSKNTTGIWNTGMGTSTLRDNTTGSESSAVGCAALIFNTTGAKNTATGAWALAYNNVGQSNVGLGWSAGRYQADGTTELTDAEHSIYIGAGSKGLSNADDNSIVIGDSAVGEGANTTVIGNENTTSTRLFGETKVEALRVSGKVILEEPQGDISMGIYE